jgi:hypothetical protein
MFEYAYASLGRSQSEWDDTTGTTMLFEANAAGGPNAIMMLLAYASDNRWEAVTASGECHLVFKRLEDAG